MYKERGGSTRTVSKASIFQVHGALVVGLLMLIEYNAVKLCYYMHQFTKSLQTRKPP